MTSTNSAGKSANSAPSKFALLFQLPPRIKEELCNNPLAYICLCAFVSFTLGLVADLVTYVATGKYLLALFNVLSLTFILISGVACLLQRISTDRLMQVLLWAMHLNILGSMTSRVFLPTGMTAFYVLSDLLIGFMVCIIASLTQRSATVLAMCLSMLIAYGGATVAIRCTEMAYAIPALCVTFILAPMFINLIRRTLWDANRKNRELELTQERLRDFFHLDDNGWQSLQEVIRTPGTSVRQLEEIFHRMGKQAKGELTLRTQKMMTDEHELADILHRERICLTPREMQVCCLMLGNKNTEETGKLLYMNASTVRFHRSKIRAKLGVDKETDLSAHIRALINGQ